MNTKNKEKDIEAEKLLVQECLKGEKPAWDKFVDRYTKLIYSMIYKTVDLKGYQLECDLIGDLHQEAFLALLKDDFSKLRKFQWKNGSSLSTWVGVLTRNLVLDYIRKESKKRNITKSLNAPIKDGESTELIDMIEDKGISVDEFVITQDNIQVLKKAFEQLPASDKQFMELLFFQELPYEEIGKILGKSTDALYMQKKRLIEKLEEIFKNLS